MIVVVRSLLVSVAVAAIAVFLPLAASAQKSASACAAPERREFGGCVLQEHWKGVEGGRGSSFNTYLPGRKKWQQTWVDSHGLTLQLYGGLQGNSMVLSGTRVTKNGVATDRITWTPLADGRVRQHWQEATANGKWQEIFDGYYSKVTR